MNSACIIAACAVASHNRTNNHINSHYPIDVEIIHKVIFRRYVHFKKVVVIRVNDNTFTPITIESQTIATQHMFCISSKRCPHGVNAYVNERYNDFVNSDVWVYHHNDTMELYKNSVKDKYGVDITSSECAYDIEFCWEVDMNNYEEHTY